MVGFNFADKYREAGFAPSPAMIELRREPFERLREEIDSARALEITRLFFSLPSRDSTSLEWFRAAFAENDASFSLVNNQREAAVLAACLLAGGLQDNRTICGLAPLTAGAGGKRAPVVFPSLLREFEHSLMRIAIRIRTRKSIDPDMIKTPVAPKVTSSPDALGSDPTELAKAMITSDNLITTNMASMTQQMKSVLAPLIEQIDDLREEVELLWWHIGGSSRVLNTPFADLEPALAAVMAGFDMAMLTRQPPGAFAAPAILQKTISANRGSKGGRGRTKVTVGEAVDAFSEHSFEELNLTDGLQTALDVCPVLAALLKASEIGPAPTWHGAFRKATGLTEDTGFTPLALALQTFRETMLVSLLDEET